MKYREVFHRNEVEMSEYSMRASDPKMLFGLFDIYEAECQRLLEMRLPLPAYDYCLKCSHSFNNLDARGAISVTERAAYIGRVRALAHLCAKEYLESREALGFPLLPPKARAAAVAGGAGGARGRRHRRRLAATDLPERDHGRPSVRDRGRGDPGRLRAAGAEAAGGGPRQGRWPRPA